MWTKTLDGSVIDGAGKVIFFSTERFKNDICLGDCCFICGASPGSKPFNDEHVLPEWILRRYDLFAREITLPNGVAIRYDRYTVPCCVECNDMMGAKIEQPISQVLQAGVEATKKFAREGGLLRMFVWMGLIFLKTHLRDRTLRFHLDARKGQQKIADAYDWELLHHIHTVVRCFYVGSFIAKAVIGSFAVIPVRNLMRFDFGDLYLAQTMFLKLDDMAVVTVFNDSGGALGHFGSKVNRITAPLSEPQLREVMTEFAFLNLFIKERPTFHSEFDLVNETHRVYVTRSTLDLADLDLSVRGRLMFHALQSIVPAIKVPGLSDKEVTAAIKAGKFTTLFDDDGNFIEAR